MRLAEAVVALRALGIQFRVREGEIRYRVPRGSLSPELRETLKKRRDEVYSLLREPGEGRWVELPRTFPCHVCGKFSFAGPGRTCYWCRAESGPEQEPWVELNTKEPPSEDLSCIPDRNGDREAA